MDRNKVYVNGTQIMLSLFEKYKDEHWVLTSSEISKKKYSFFLGNGENIDFVVINMNLH